MKTSDGGMDANDHAIVIGWIEMQAITKSKQEMKTPSLPTIRPTDKGAIRKLEKIFKHTTDGMLDKMKMEGIIILKNYLKNGKI